MNRQWKCVFVCMLFGRMDGLHDFGPWVLPMKAYTLHIHHSVFFGSNFINVSDVECVCCFRLACSDSESKAWIKIMLYTFWYAVWAPRLLLITYNCTSIGHGSMSCYYWFFFFRCFFSFFQADAHWFLLTREVLSLFLLLYFMRLCIFCCCFWSVCV